MLSKKVNFLLTGVLYASTSCARLVLHEKRDALPNERLDGHRVDENILLPIRIGLRENRHALANAEKWLMDVSSPDSPLFGQHWTQEQVIDVFRPSRETIANVTAWLSRHGVFDFTHSDNKLWFAFDMPAGKAEKMLNSEYFVRDVGDGFEVSCEQYFLPDYLQEHIHYITPGVKGSDVTTRAARNGPYKRSNVRSARELQKRGIIPRPPPPPAFISPTSLEHCDKIVTPACIRALYGFSAPDPNESVSPNNSLGIFAYLDVDWQGDQNLFYKYFAPEIPWGIGPLFDRIDHGLYSPNKSHGTNWYWYEGEEALDLQTSLPIIYPQTVTVFNVGPVPLLYGNNLFNRFFDAVDGSYCSDAQQGNFSKSGGRPQCGVFKPTNVLSFSYGIPEHEYSFYWQERQCNEYLKLGLQGTSVFICSQDWGVGKKGQWVRRPGFNDKTCNHDYENRARIFMPAFPAACPWVTSVGATEIHTGNTVNDPEIGAVWPGYNVSSGTYRWSEYSSGGGFALHFPTPAYQKGTLSDFFKNNNPRWPYFTNGHWQNGTGRYNRNGRGIPDISAAGKNIATFFRNGYQAEAGTSSATPILAALFNRIVEERLRNGKGPLGFINPTLYKHPEAFNDVTQGKNGYCTKHEGFEAGPGWDPMTGLGTPIYPKLHDIFVNLP